MTLLCEQLSAVDRRRRVEIVEQSTIDMKEKSIQQHEESICVSCRCFHEERRAIRVEEEGERERRKKYHYLR